jgi:vancomycin resistance protein VanJ
VTTRLLRGAVLLWVVVVLALNFVTLVFPQRSGLLALSEVFAPYLFLPLLAGAVVWTSRARGTRILRLGLLACALVFVVRFVPGWVALPASAATGSTEVSVATWNLELGFADPIRIVEGLSTAQPGLVALEELTPRHAAAIEADPTLRARFPYRFLHPQIDSSGLGLLSSYPIAGDPVVSINPPMLTANVEVPDGRIVRVVVAHPVPANLGSASLVTRLVSYDPSIRDGQLTAIRASLDRPIEAGLPVILLGDFNVTEREPGYHDLTRGLFDAQSSSGIGPAPTWRPHELEWLPLALLRIDLVLTGGTAKPLGISVDCTPRGSDHCLVRGTVELLPSRPQPAS